MLHNPDIKVRGGKATGQWYVKATVTLALTNRALWVAEKYEAEYAKVNGKWRFERMIGRHYFITPYDEGWVTTKTYK